MALPVDHSGNIMLLVWSTRTCARGKPRVCLRVAGTTSVRERGRCRAEVTLRWSLRLNGLFGGARDGSSSVSWDSHAERAHLELVLDQCGVALRNTCAGCLSIANVSCTQCVQAEGWLPLFYLSRHYIVPHELMRAAIMLFLSTIKSLYCRMVLGMWQMLRLLNE